MKGKRIVLVLVGLMIFSALSLMAQWNIQTLDETGNAGRHSDVAYDNEGNPHIVYLNGSTYYYTYWTGSGWNTQSINSTDDTPGYYACKIFLNSNNLPIT